MDSLYTSSFEYLRKCINVRNIVFSVAILVIGGAIAFYSTRLTDSTISSLTLCIGSIAVLCALYFMCFRATHWVYLPTGSAVKSDSVSYDAKRFDRLWNSLADDFGFGQLRSAAEQSTVRMDYIYSIDKKFVAFQLYQYSSLLYTPITEVYILKGDKAGHFVERIRQGKQNG